MNLNLKEHLEKLIQEQNQPTDKDRITALESAIGDLALMFMEVSNND